ncbi:glycosyltransferase family 39 protein [Streptomyces sp. NBC_01197]|uniref:glycosyltransferase family 39 protein n=1 Tax=Streptomyces sp. NBC_01197 TaxID=2903768 RepID=UPI002E14BFA0|nr:hypothetical protein OG452_15835 [Streptomyces sp. NBC_01197]
MWGIRRDGTLWGDEAVTYEMAHRGVAGIWRTLATVDAVHGLYYLLMHAVFALHDGGLTTLRLPSVLATSAASAGVGLIGHRLAGPRAGLFAGLAMPLIPAVQRYAQEGRSYALVCALVVWATWLLLAKRWTAYGSVMLVACLLHEFAVLAVAAHGVTVFARRAGRAGFALSRRAFTWAAAGVAVGLAPLAVFSTTQSAQVEWIGRPGVSTLAGYAALTAAALLCRRFGPAPGVRALALPLLLVPSWLLLAVSYVHPLYVDRYVLFCSAGLALLTGAVLDHCWSRAVGLAAVAAALVALLPVGLELRTPQSRKNDVTAVSTAVEAAGRPGDGLLFTPARRRVWTLWRPADFRGLTDLSLSRTPRASHTLSGTESAPGRIRDRIRAARRIVVVSDLPGQPLDTGAREAVKRRALRTYFVSCGSREITSALITVYARPGGCPSAWP